MDILSKTANKVGEVASQAAATATQWYRLDSEQRRLATLRAHALQARAQIGEEMYLLWKSGAFPPSSLDELFRDVERTMTAIDVQRTRVEELRAGFSGGPPPANPITILDQDSHLQVVEVASSDPDQAAPAEQLSPPLPPAPQTLRLPAASSTTPVVPGDTLPATGSTAAAGTIAYCHVCGRAGPAGKAFCGYCGARLA